ncbi:MAG: hypothetical protein ACKVP0_01085 [Pirellulaceae bacterium]
MTEKHLIKWLKNGSHDVIQDRLEKGPNESVLVADNLQNICLHNNFRQGATRRFSSVLELESGESKYPGQGETGRLSLLISRIEPDEGSAWPSERAAKSWITQAVAGLPGFQAGSRRRFGVIAHFGGAVL